MLTSSLTFLLYLLPVVFCNYSVQLLFLGVFYEITSNLKMDMQVIGSNGNCHGEDSLEIEYKTSK